MDILALGEYTTTDYAWLEESPFEDDSVFASEFMPNDYVRVTQLFCDGVGRQYKDYAESERNLEFDICNMWCTKPVSILRDYCDAIKIHIFWPLLFQHQHSSIISRLYPCVEATSSHTSEISLKELQHLELMEDIVDLAKKVMNDSFFIGGLLRIGYKIENNILAMEEALNWVKYTGDVTILSKLGEVDNCWPMLSIFFTEYKYHITKVVTENCNILDEFKRQTCAECIQQGELMKMKGNEEFSKERFDLAIIYYSRAIEYSPENYHLYGNRALCFLRTGQFRHALGDGKRAIILKNNWTKGHYRYCAALYMLGEYDWALQANSKAQKLCKNDPEGINDLIQQHVKLQQQIEDLQGGTPTRNPIKAFYESGANTPSLPAPAFSTSLNFVEIERDSSKTYHEMAYDGNQPLMVVDEALNIDDCACHPEFLPLSGQPPKYKGKQKSRNNELEFSYGSQGSFPADLKSLLEKQFSKSSRAAHQDFANIMKMLRSLIQDGYTALLEQRCRSAAQSFSELLNGLDPQKVKQLNLAMINYVLVVYGLAISLLGIGQPEELSEAENQFKRMIEHYPNEGLDCLAYCGIGKVYLKKNRFLEALNHFEKARTLICRLPGVLTWPTSNVVIEETRPGKIKMLLEKFIEECRFPPVPDAVCCYQKCRGYSKIQIYITDPDFKGFIRISCCQYCKIEFHMNCWKKLKTTTFNDKIDKEFLQGICLTPDCEGIISKIIIFSSGGQVKCEFEHKVVKEKKVPSKPILKQKCSSLEKLRLKEDKKLKRKIQKQEAKKLAQERMEEDLRESNPPKTEEQKETVASAESCQFLDDRILQCIKQYADKIKSGVLNASTLLKELLSWKVLSTEDYTTCFSSRNFLSEAVDYVIRHLIQEKNRVKTRIFLHVLSELKEVEPKLATWIQKLNSFGLDATESFFSRYGASLKELDFSIMTFLWNEKYGHKLNSIEGKQLDYFCESASLKEARCLIWLLEEHRDKFPALHNALDEFFDIMDSRCTVLRKQDSGDVPFNPTKIKNKGKKKKPKDLKPMLVGSGTTSVTPNNETIASGEDHKRNSNSTGPFVVPDHLRQDVAEFEALYGQHSNEYVVRKKKLWDINPKQKSSTLYDYFSQLLEEHGPLDMSNKMFSEEYEFFPEETRQILEKAGGLKSFLLGCPRFVVIDNCIALKKVASRLKKKRRKKNIKTKVEEMSKTGEYLRVKLPLNPTAREFKPDVKSKAVSSLSSAPASEGAKPQPASADFPKPACEAEKPQTVSKLQPVSKPQPVSENSRRSVSEGEKPKEVAPSPPKAASEDASRHPQGRSTSISPKPVHEDVKTTYWTQAHVVTGYCTYLPFRAFELTPPPPAYISMVPTLPQYTNIYTPLATISTEYQLQTSVTVVSSYVANDRPDQSAAVYFDGRRLNAEHAPGNQIASETQILQDSLEISVKSQDSTGGADPAQSEPSRNNGHCGNSAHKQEANPERTDEATNIPHTQVVAIQVSGNVAHQEVNTEPYDPFEAQQGDISQIEKESHVLQEQLEEACENYEQRKLKGSEETRDLEEKLKRNLEENKISKTELDWFLEDLQKEIKKWQQEKKEIQERLAALKKEMKRVSDATETYTQKNDGQEKEHEFLLDQSSEISNTFTNEKTKIEEQLRKGKEQYEEVLQRAVAAEVSVLENRREAEVYKLQIVESQAEGYLKTLKQLRSDSAAYPELESDIHSWESFLSDVRKEIEKAESQFEEHVKAVKTGSRLSELPDVQISALPFPAWSSIRPKSLPESPGQDEQGPSTSASHGTGNHTLVPRDSSLVSAGDRPLGAPSPSLPASPSAQQKCEGASQAAQPKRSPPADQKLPGPPGRTARPSQSPKRPFNSILEHLSAVLPCYSSTELAGFIRKVRNKSKTSLSGLSIDEIVQKVTAHILEEQQSQKPRPGQDRPLAEPSPTASGMGAAQGPPSVTAGPSPKARGQRTEDAPTLGAHSCEICHEVFKSKNVRALSCGHKFHKGCFKQCLKGQRTCPACLGRDLPSGE
ncbi:PREDICTED: E3 ubiquitin-protein ligase TTC3 isoform X1 [Myotis davidii]|uniref:E3 ubiquitin-protein ligase TTC3 isoform X1 n=3 Tax=Myotis davidii TaxID=225400 RepID=UPI0003EC36E3|nr:PREDICTED: E3 ubiquitin-protein ligase TTC3 isoform X1 [Myotis davidii]